MNKYNRNEELDNSDDDVKRKNHIYLPRGLLVLINGVDVVKLMNDVRSGTRLLKSEVIHTPGFRSSVCVKGRQQVLRVNKGQGTIPARALVETMRTTELGLMTQVRVLRVMSASWRVFEVPSFQVLGWRKGEGLSWGS